PLPARAALCTLFPYTTLFRSRVMRPFAFRPPDFFSGSVRLFSGSVFVISSNDETDMKRRPGLVGLYLRMATMPEPPRRSRSTRRDRKSTRLNSSHDQSSYAVF